MTDYSYILSEVYPDADWNMVGDDYEGLNWLSESPKPSKAELDQAYIDYKAANDYKAKRASEYPSIEEQLDLMYHLGVAGWKIHIASIKDKYRKPS